MIRIGTRGSKLALIQANKVKKELIEKEIDSELVIIKTEGDRNQSAALNNFTSPGVFTKELDKAIMENRIDVAVHSGKDLPSKLEDELMIAAVLERDDFRDVIVGRQTLDFLDSRESEAVIATGSVRRKAQWMHKYPKHEIVSIRGNIDTRLNKLFASDWDGLIVAKAALNRLGIEPENSNVLNDFIPAPCQGIIALTAKKEASDILEMLNKINHEETFNMAQIERSFLQYLQVGCSFPVGGVATVESNKIKFVCELLEPSGKEKIKLEKTAKLNDFLSLGENCAIELLKKGQHLLNDTTNFNHT